MKTIGLIGSPSWDDTVEAARRVNVHTRIRRGGLRSAPCVIATFGPLPGTDEAVDDEASAVHAGLSVVRGGAQVVALCTVDQHRYAEAIAAAIAPVPLIHVADAVGARLTAEGIGRVAVIGSRAAMEGACLVGPLRAYVQVVLPDEEDRIELDRIVHDEMRRGRRLRASRERVFNVVAGMVSIGAEAVLLATSELEALVEPDLSVVTVYDAGELHAAAIVDAALHDGRRVG